MPTQNDPDSANGFIPLSSDEETSPSLIRKEIATSSSPSTSPSLIRHVEGTPPPRTDPVENDQDLRTPATTNKQRRAAHNESTQTRLTQQSNRTTQGSEDDIDIEEIATRERESDREREGEREGERERANDVSGREKRRKRGGKNETERESERETRRERATRREPKREEKENTTETETENEMTYHKQVQGPDQQTATMLA